MKKLNDSTESHVRDKVHSKNATDKISADKIPDKIMDKMRILLTEYDIIFAKTSYDIKSTD